MNIANIIFPNRCLGCGSMEIEQDREFCPSCWGELIFLKEPYCACCGLPFIFDDGLYSSNESLCDHCNKSLPAYDKARCLFVYSDVIKKPILSLKHYDNTQYAKTFAKLMARMQTDLCQAVDLIVPIPLHWKRLILRQYNQAALIAKHLGNILEKPVDYKSLIRFTNTKSQGHQSRKNRQTNVENAFQLKEQVVFKDKNILLIDDVMTTGSTLHEAAKVIKLAKPKGIYCLSIARSVLGSDSYR
jgi:ComF family protein